MLQFILTALAGIALGIVGMRVWQSRAPGSAADRPDQTGAAVDQSGADSASAGFSSGKLLMGAGALVVAAVAVFLLRGPQNDAPGAGATGAAAAMGGSDQPVGDVDSMIARLADRLKTNPNDGEGFRMLGWSYLMTGHPDQALEPYKRAMQLLPRQANAYAGYGEALVAVAKNRVTDEAKASFDRALALDPKEPRARYFHALWQSQNGQQREALDKWIALANESPADASWQADLRKQIDETAAALGQNVAGRIKTAASSANPAMPALKGADVQAAEQLPAGERQAMINGMVEGLAARLKANPRDADGWVKLMRSRMVLGQGDQAARDLASARAAFRGDAGTLQKLDMAAAALKVSGN